MTRLVYAPPEQRFWQFVRKTNACWFWTGASVNNGYGGSYGVFNAGERKTKTILAHRYSFLIHCGPIPKGLLVCHTCDVRLCVNPDHLFLGTAKDNTQDMVKKQRNSRGEQKHNAKLTDDAVREIRNSADVQSAIAARYGVTQAIISEIKSRKRWAHVV